MIPLKPSGDGFGSNAFAKSLSPPSRTMIDRKYVSTTATEINASVSCTRVEIWTPKYRTTNNPSAKIRSHTQIGKSPPSTLNTPGIRLSWT